ncbi:MAG: TetR/AcrR family transcriptional regulator [Proteobacteria bacterium]|nr:TetR/AcrR family transcriptional regulator [Pseudomonadota bacterium]MDA1064321.1 TetR/AcrR family transcriptional regulator [Pseudomonadota bacterium]
MTKDSSDRSPESDQKSAAAPRRRLRAVNREQQIIDEAVSFFAEKGFSGQTRELGARLGITQPLLYRYFPTKRDLIERVFNEVYLNLESPDWSNLLTDRSRPLHDRFCDFYGAYSDMTYRYEWIRIFMFAALMGEKLNRRYTQLVEKKILTPMCDELRHYCDQPSIEEKPIRQLELDHIWVMHGGLFYYAIRKHIYHGRVSKDFPAIVSRAVAVMLAGSKAISAQASYQTTNG